MIACPTERRQGTAVAGQCLLALAQELPDRAALCLGARALDAVEVLHRGVDFTERLSCPPLPVQHVGKRHPCLRRQTGRLGTASQRNRRPQMPHRSSSTVCMQGSKPQSAFSDGGRREVVSSPRLRGHYDSKRCRLAWVCICQPERLTCLVGQGGGHVQGE